MEHPAGEADDGSLRVDFDRRLKLEFHGTRITSDAGLPAYRELDDALGLTDLVGAALAECRRGKNTRHLLTGLFRQSVFGRLAGYEDVNDADRLAHDPAMRAVVDRSRLDRRAASTSQMGRFETGWLSSKVNLTALADLSGSWIERVHARKPHTTIVLDMDSSASVSTVMRPQVTTTDVVIGTGPTRKRPSAVKREAIMAPCRAIPGTCRRRH
jgi:hypothetical protein